MANSRSRRRRRSSVPGTTSAPRVRQLRTTHEPRLSYRQKPYRADRGVLEGGTPPRRMQRTVKRALLRAQRRVQEGLRLAQHFSIPRQLAPMVRDIPKCKKRPDPKRAAEARWRSHGTGGGPKGEALPRKFIVWCK